MTKLQTHQKTYIIPPSNEFAIFMINPIDDSDLGIFVFFNSTIGFKEKIINAYYVFNPDGDFIEFKSKFNKFLTGKSDVDLNIKTTNSLEELLNVSIQFFGKTEDLAYSQDDFSTSIRSCFLPSGDNEDENETDDQIPPELLQSFFNWVFNYPECLFD